MSPELLLPDAILLPTGLVSGVSLGIEEGRITHIGRHTGSASPRRLAGTLLPGAIDMQVNGAGGRDVGEGSVEALDRIATTVLAGGATAFLPTLISAPFPLLLERLRAVARWIESGPTGGAQPLGIHLEGPFLELAGAHPPEALIDPTPERIEAILDAAAGHLALVTLAPGREGAVEAVRSLTAAGVRVSLGHGADAGAFTACVDAGATLVTHLFNAMSPIHHRRASLALAALDDPRLLCGVIADGQHLSAPALRLAWRILGRQRMLLVTDSSAPAGCGDGTFLLGDRRVEARGGVVTDEEGGLAGSAALMRDVVAGMGAAVEELEPADWAALTSTNAARALGLTTELVPGAPARFSLLGPHGEWSARIA